MRQLARLALLLTTACSGADQRARSQRAVASTEPGTIGASASFGPQSPSSAWLDAHALPLASVEAGNGFDDLAPLAQWIGDARIVGLGEGTHGTREFFQAKHRLLEFLVERLGFTIFSIEANMPEAYALDAYVLGQDGDVDALIEGMYFWTWRTEEVRDMVEWMRAYNAAHKDDPNAHPVHFTGFDMQTGAVAIEVVRRFLARYDRDWILAGGGNTLLRLAQHDPWSCTEQDFACATAQFPVAQARGKHVRLSGWIKTERVEDGWAGLWWRVDGPTPWFDNMQERGVTGTSDWEQREIELDVPGDAQELYFGLVQPGIGKSWFDDLSIEIDGERWTSADFDLGFEAARPRGLLPVNPSGGRTPTQYRGAYDASVARSGKQSFAFERLSSDRPDAPDAEEMRTAATNLLAHMQGSRELYARHAEPADIEWGMRNARLVEQWTKFGDNAGSAHRDACMAENIAWIAERNPDARIVVWAHNGHVQNQPPYMGAHLRERFGASYVNVGFCASHGAYTARGRIGRELGTFPLAEPPPESFEALLEASGKPRLLVDLRQARSDDPDSAWLTETRPFGGYIGALAMPQPYTPTPLRERFDLLLWIKDSTAARQLPGSDTR